MNVPGVLVSRRAFFMKAAAFGSASVAALGQQGNHLNCANGGVLDLRTLTEAQFAPLVGSTFELCGEDGSRLTARLRRVRSLRAPAEAGVGRNDPFALIFRTRRDENLVQQTYTVAHERLGRFAAFLAPVGLPDRETRLEAIFA